jgi:hypothetical protein
MEDAEEFEFADISSTPPMRSAADKHRSDEALIYCAPDHEGPGTHVLIVGISYYPFLNGGSDPRPDIAQGMGQLDAPAPSARALATWFLDEFDNPHKPLASLALVLSEESPAVFSHPKAPGGSALPLGTFADVRSAVQNWVGRASSNPQNQVIFFFSGHGVSSANPLALLRDYCEARGSKFDGALKLNDLFRVVSTHVPEYQLFLIDSCRVPQEVSNPILGNLAVGRQAFDEELPLAVRGGKPATQSIHHATAELSPAYGRHKGDKQGLSLFTDALLQALRGGGAQSNQQWWVSTLGLQNALDDYVRHFARKENVEQQPHYQGYQFRVNKPAVIHVPVYITTAPSDGLQKVERVEVRLKSTVAAAYDPVKDGAQEQWACVLKHFDHDLVVTFPQASDYDDYLDTLKLSPPSAPFEVPLRRRR